MKRFLILFALITYSVVGCAGPNKSVKPDVRPGDIEKDREECIQSIDATRSQTFTNCLAKKGYKVKVKGPSLGKEDILALTNPYTWADVILTIPVVLTIKLIDQRKTEESPKEDNNVDDEKSKSAPCPFE